MIAIESYLAVTGDPVHVVERSADGEVSALSRRLAELAPWLTVIGARCNDGPCPRLRVEGLRPHGEITFVGPIEDRQREPFVMLLRTLATGQIDYETPATPALLRELTRPVALSVAVSATCPRCPAVSAAVLRFALATPLISVTVARADLGLASAVAAVPTVRLDGHDVASGAIGEYALAERVVAAG